MKKAYYNIQRNIKFAKPNDSFGGEKRFTPLDKGKIGVAYEGFAVCGEQSNPKSRSDFIDKSLAALRQE